MVQKSLDQGSFGTVYECVDVNKPNLKCVIKVSDDYKMLSREIEALKDIRKMDKATKTEYPYDYVPTVLSKGMFILEAPAQDSMSDQNPSADCSQVFKSFYIMPKFGRNLESLFAEHNYNFSDKTVYQLGIQLLRILEKIHQSGNTFNDLKLDNILVGDQNLKDKNMHKIRLVDFGFASRFLDKHGKHIKEEEVDVFRGNMVFASVNMFDFKSPSRRDDLMSLCYLLIYLLNSGNVPFVVDNNMSKNEVFLHIMNIKLNMPLEELCSYNKSRAWPMLKMFKCIFDLSFDESPDYSSYRQMLKECIHSQGHEYDQVYDWNMNG